MSLESWLPIGYELPDGACCGRPLHGGTDWQIVETRGEGSALLVKEDLVRKWVESGLIEDGAFWVCAFGSEKFREISSGRSQIIAPLAECRSPESKSEALAFAMALRATRDIDAGSPLQDAIYVEKYGRLLPSYGITSRTDDDVVLGYWLTGGARVSVKSFRRLRQMLTWMDANQLRDVVEAAGFEVTELIPSDIGKTRPTLSENSIGISVEEKAAEEALAHDESVVGRAFELPGRPELEMFFNEHVVDIVSNKERYKALGVGFPSAVVLHGPPGCGKTFAVEKLIEFMGWPSFQIDASSVASPYIHETSRKVSEMFDKAMENAPSVLVIDEMEAFLADRETGGGGSHHRVEEVAEFLRRIPEAAKNEVLIVAMTNRVEMIDPAIMRRGRFDHVIKVDFASEKEVRALLDKMLSSLPLDDTVSTGPLAKQLAGRPLSDVAFIVREGARLAARAGKNKLGQAYLMDALESAPSRTEEGIGRRIGFV
ncbi:MAG: ATP-binding protein [Rhodocyclales bacterium]|nr:ATP-binding protein [Rhodocyclales bacterium]